MTAEQNKQAQAIITYFQEKYKEKFNKRAVVNRNKVQFLIANMLNDLTPTEIKKIIDFYVRTDKNPSLLYLCYEYDEVIEAMETQEKDLAARKALLAATEQRVKEFRERYGNAGK